MTIARGFRDGLRSPLAKRLIVAIVLASSVVTLCLTVLQIYGDYRREVGEIRAVFRQIEEVHLTSLSQSLWATDENDLHLRLEGIVRTPNIEYAAVSEGDKLWVRAGRRVSRSVIERHYPMMHRYRGELREIGVLTIVAGLDGVYRQLMNQALVVLASNALKTFLVAGFAFALFHWLVNRHLLFIAQSLRNHDLREPAPALKLVRAGGSRPDELDEVVEAINVMHHNTSSAIETLHESEERYRSVVELSPEAIFINQGGRIVFGNGACLALLGARSADQVVGKSVFSIVHPDSHASVREAMAVLMAGGDRIPTSERKFLRLDGTTVEAEIVASVLPYMGAPAIQVHARDITERKRAEEAREQSRKQLLEILDNMFPFVGLFSTDGILLEANRSPFVAGGVEREDALGKPFAETYWWSHSPDVQERLRSAMRRAAAGEVVRYDEIVRMANDERVAVDVMFSPLRNPAGKVVQIIGSGVDISARKRAERELVGASERLRELTTRLVETEEAERRKINRELHDRVGQSLSTLNLSLNLIHAQLPEKALAAVGQRLADAQKLLETAVQNTRDVMADLRPPALDDFGLLAALKTYAEPFSKRSGIPVAVKGAKASPRFPSAIETALFRIAQEALANIAKHARARSVQIVLAVNGHGMELTVADDGVGFDPASARPERGGWGMRTMRERAEAVGATLRVVSAPGRGTRVVVEAALESA